MKNKVLWILWLLVSLALASVFGKTLLVDDNKSNLLIGESTYGHYQIELACSSCHTDPFGGDDVLQDACSQCHAAELESSHDSHPKKKFTDPREAYRLEIIDARYCVSCHQEHQQEKTNAMGLTLPNDYCFHCHQEIGNERESHKDLPFDSCASSGCHNYHDNRALYESFLLKNADGHWLNENAHIPPPNAAKYTANKIVQNNSALISDTDTVEQEKYPDIHQQWSQTGHAQAGVGCDSCHRPPTQEPNNSVNSQVSNDSWIEKPTIKQCQTCHKDETSGFLASKHGMRLSPDVTLELTAITPAESHMPFNRAANDIEHGCNSCHAAHDFNPQKAAAEACLNCHNDNHSLTFENSPHGKLWQQELNGEISEGAGVSCATCHMPREIKELHKNKNKGKNLNESGNSNTSIKTTELRVRVEHNQNLFLRPNEKMIRPVCMQCHNLQFSLNALADPTLIHNNFSGEPSQHIESIDWALRRENADKQ